MSTRGISAIFDDFCAVLAAIFGQCIKGSVFSCAMHRCFPKRFLRVIPALHQVLKRVWVCRATLLSALGAKDPEATNKVAIFFVYGSDVESILKTCYIFLKFFFLGGGWDVDLDGM